MRKYMFTISAGLDGETLLHFYNLESTQFFSEAEFLESFKEFYPQYTEVGMRSFRTIEAQLRETVAA